MEEKVTAAPQTLSARGSNRSRQPANAEFRAFMGADWDPRPDTLPQPLPSAAFTGARRLALGRLFVGERLVIPAGQLQVRNNDCDYRFRPHSAFAHMSGLGTDQQPDAVIVLHPLQLAEKNSSSLSNSPSSAAQSVGGESKNSESNTHESILYFRPRASRQSEEFYADARYGELWVGVRPSLAEVSALTGIKCKHIDELSADLAENLGVDKYGIRVVPNADPAVESLVANLCEEHNLGENFSANNDQLAEALSELRLRKDAFEVNELQAAVDASKRGFEQIIRDLPRAQQHPRGERVVEGAFGRVAREEGNGLGYETIAASGNHANTLHWICNDGPVKAGELILVDAGVEVDSLYTADVTRTLPTNGVFTSAQKQIYEAVLEAADASFVAAGQKGAKFRDLHNAAMQVLATKLEEWGMLPGTAAESLAPNGQFHRRWMVHGTSHHLGLDVHDCAQARREMYMDAELEPGMCFTIEPGLYFRADDRKVPPHLRGMAVRIEDDIVIDPDGTPRRLTADIPRTVADIEAWMADLWK